VAGEGDLTPGELSRRVQELLLQFEALLRKVEDRYVQKETLQLIREALDNRLGGLEQVDQGLERSKASVTDLGNLRSLLDDKASKADLDAVKSDVDELKDNNKWLFRLVGAFIILAILGAVFTAGGGLAK